MDSEQAFNDAREAWRSALREHVLAPPDAGFSGRLEKLAAAAARRAAACEAANRDGFEWPATHGGAKPPYEFAARDRSPGPRRMCGSGSTRPSPSSIGWKRGASMLAVGRAYAELAEITSQLAKVVEREDPAPAASFRGPRRSVAGRPSRPTEFSHDPRSTVPVDLYLASIASRRPDRSSDNIRCQATATALQTGSCVPARSRRFAPRQHTVALLRVRPTPVGSSAPMLDTLSQY